MPAHGLAKPAIKIPVVQFESAKAVKASALLRTGDQRPCKASCMYKHPSDSDLVRKPDPLKDPHQTRMRVTLALMFEPKRVMKSFSGWEFRITVFGRQRTCKGIRVIPSF